MSPLLLVGAGLAAFLLWFFLAFRNHLASVDKNIPRLPGSTYLGAVPLLDVTNVYRSFVLFVRQYGRVFSFHIFGEVTVATADPNMIMEILSSPNARDKSVGGYEDLKAFLGETALLSINGEEWRKRRKLLSKVFHTQQMHMFIRHFTECADVMCTELEAQPKYAPIDVSKFTMRFAMDVITRAMFTRKFGLQTDPNAPLGVALHVCAAEMSSRLYNPFHKYTNLYAQYRFRKALGLLHRTFLQIVEEHRAEMDQEKSNLDLVDLMVRAQDEETGFTFTDKDILSQCHTFYFAGHDTTAHTIAWALFLIAGYPEVERRIREETESVMGSESERGVTLSDLQRMVYLDAVVKETLRLYPPAPVFSRVAKCDTTFGGYEVKQGTTLTVVANAVHFDEQNYPDPFTFNPDRWLTDEKRHPCAYLPFSLKERMCIGMHFGLLESKAVLSKLTQRFQFRRDLTRYPVVGSQITQCPTQGVSLFVTKRFSSD